MTTSNKPRFTTEIRVFNTNVLSAEFIALAVKKVIPTPASITNKADALQAALQNSSETDDPFQHSLRL